MKWTVVVGRYDREKANAAQGQGYPPPYENAPAKRYETFEVDLPEHAVVLDALIEIREYQDESLVVRCACRSAICGSCAMWVNGHAKLACKSKLQDHTIDGKVTVEAPPSMPVIRDLVADMTPFWEKNRKVKPWLENKQPVPTGELGSLQICGDSTLAYYWNKHEKTKDTMNGHWIHTGDKYYQDADGYFWYCGRADDMLKVSGQWVSPVEVENTLITHPAVLEAAVVGADLARTTLLAAGSTVGGVGRCIETGAVAALQVAAAVESRLAGAAWRIAGLALTRDSACPARADHLAAAAVGHIGDKVHAHSVAVGEPLLAGGLALAVHA